MPDLVESKSVTAVAGLSRHRIFVLQKNRHSWTLNERDPSIFCISCANERDDCCNLVKDDEENFCWMAEYKSKGFNASFDIVQNWSSVTGPDVIQ